MYEDTVTQGEITITQNELSPLRTPMDTTKARRASAPVREVQESLLGFEEEGKLKMFWV